MRARKFRRGQPGLSFRLLGSPKAKITSSDSPTKDLYSFSSEISIESLEGLIRKYPGS